MKCAGRDCLVLVFAVFTIVPRVKSSHFRGEAPQIPSSGGQLRKTVNVSRTPASLLRLKRGTSENNASAASVDFEKVVQTHQLKDIMPAGTTIPNKLLMNYKSSLGTLLAKRAMDEKGDEHGIKLLPAISKTMDLMPDAELIFADNEKCRNYIVKTHSEELANFFDQQEQGMYKSDLCRFAMLYEEGGYYFDNDMDLIQDVRKMIRKMNVEGASFVSATEFPWHGKVKFVSEAFVAAAPRHPVVRLILDAFLEWYHKSLQPGWTGGPLAVYAPAVAGDALMAWLNIRHFDRLTGLYTYTPPGGKERRAYFFKETNDIHKYKLTDRNTPGKCCCNFFFADEDEAWSWAHTRGTSEKEC